MSYASALLHPALDATLEAIPLAKASLSDQQAVAVLFQGAALLAHLEHGGWCLLHGWETARVTKDGLLKVEGAVPGRGAEAPQVLLLDLMRRVGLWSGRGGVSSKGTARKAAGRLLARWRQHLAPESPDRAVAEILGRAPFLWHPNFAAARLALLAEHVPSPQGDDNSAASHVWIAGPGRHRNRLLARARDLDGLSALVASGECRDLWEGYRKGDDPVELSWKGRSLQAAVCWRRRPPEGPEERYLYARCLFDLGLVAEADEELKKLSSFEARLLRLKCQGELGNFTWARQALVRLAKKSLDASRTVEVAEVAVRLLARKGEHESSQEWVRRALGAAPGHRGRLHVRALLLAAEAAWDRKDLDASARYLARVRAAQKDPLKDPELARRWHEARSLLAIGHRDGAAVTEHSTAALSYRRRMTRIEAGRRWNDLGYGRLLSGDLAGAERAIRHAVRLFDPTESPVRNTLGLANLAGIRLRRGNVEGVAEILEVSARANADNPEGRVADVGLQVRLELVRGRPEEALGRCREAFEMIASHGVGDRELFELLAARALGWMGRRQEAAARLARVSPEIFFEIEPEERPAVWALAGCAEQAAREAADTPFADLWAAHAAGLDPSPRAWEALESLEEFRSARLVYDYLTVASESVPSAWIRRAVDGLRRTGAFHFASRLEKRFSSPWKAVEDYFDPASSSAADIAGLFDSAGFPEARIVYSHRAGETVVKAGQGGDRHLEAGAGDGLLVLASHRIDPALRALFFMIRRDFTPPLEKTRSGSAEPARRSLGDMLGESPVFLETLAKLDRLARGELPILILGESGTGKERSARRIHEMSRRRSGPFAPVNCAALPESNMAQTELFGHVRGAYTGAHRDHQGIFERTRGGTVFLDEVGDLSLEIQGKLLRVLQEREVQRLGDELVRKIDVRIVAATNRDLARMVGEGQFRQDLFYRLAGAHVELPPLRERGSDIPILARHLLKEAWRRLETPHEAPPELSAEVEKRLLRHGWPGNVRELQRTMERAATLAVGGRIRADDLGLAEKDEAPAGNYHDRVEHFKVGLIRSALEKSGGNQAQAARSLGMRRQAFSYLAKKMGLL